jgi:hypothetical protein
MVKPGYTKLSWIYNRAKGLLIMTGRHLSITTLWLIFAGVCIYNLQNKDWDKPARLIKDDVHLYYIYTSAAIVHHDLRFGRIYNKIPGYARRNLWLPTNKDTGRSYSKMSMGLAMVYTPFTAFAHYVLVPVTDANPDGYSPPYKMGLLMSALLFFLIGLWHLRKVLLEHFSETITALTLIVIAFGTNLSWYITSEATMSHAYSFALIIYFYRLLQKWFSNPRIGLTMLTGLVFGLLVLIRPTNLMFIVLFFATSDFRERILFLLKNYGKILLMMAMFLLVWVPQFAFWKYVSGNWFFYTYSNESFFWNNPQIINSIISFRKGWLVYTPLMALAFIGLPFLWKQSRPLFWQVVSVLAILIYINSSWWCWWFGGSFGNRAYIDGYGIFALSIAAFFKYMAERKNKVMSYAGVLLIAAFVCLNLFQTWQYRMGLMHYDSMTRESYFSNFLKTNIDPDYEGSLVMPDHDAGIYGIYYPNTEMTFSRKKQLRTYVETNQQYFLTYYKTLAPLDLKIQKKISNQPGEQEKDSVYSVWTQEQLNMLLKRL